MAKTAQTNQKGSTLPLSANLPSKMNNENAKADIGWTFLTNHAQVLILIDKNPDRVLREIALEIGITERAVQRIVHELIDAKYLVRTKRGRCNHYRVNRRKKLRHPIESHSTVEDLFELARERSAD